MNKLRTIFLACLTLLAVAPILNQAKVCNAAILSESEHSILFDYNLIMLICSQDDPKLMSDFDNNKQQIKNILDEMIAIDLFQIRDDYLICESVINRVKEMAETSRKKATRGATKKGIVPEWMNE